MKNIEYGEWAAHPEIVGIAKVPRIANAVWKEMFTKYEGRILYYKLWNFWVRDGVTAEIGSDRYFRDYESSNTDIDKLFRDIGLPWKKGKIGFPWKEEEIWNRIGVVWNWLRDNVEVNNEEYCSISSVDGEWPSILDYARYYVSHGKLVWAACFSKAHLFATLLGRAVYPRFRVSVAEAHHTEFGAPPTATHVYVAVYVSERWFYIDPSAIGLEDFPDFKNRKSIGVDSFETVDYEHPYMFIPVPLSGFEGVAYLPK